MALVNFTDLDFDQIKESIKDYLKANSNFTDYDYEGSNLSTIINTLAYNTYISSYNANMASNEVFIDSATLRENVVSLARNIGYVPRSRKAASANVSFAVNVSGTTAVSVTLKSGLSFISNKKFGNTTYVFSIPNDITVPVDSNGFANFLNVDIFEGTYIKQTYTVSSRNPDQKYIIPNGGADTSLVRVSVKPSSTSSVSRKYTPFNGLYDLGPNSPIYFLQEIESERYEILFGDGIFGAKLEEPNFVEISYITSHGADANNIDSFSFSGSLVDNKGNAMSTGVSLITTNIKTFGGKDIESVESIKKYAPQVYASQHRAVTAADYEALVPLIYPEAESVSAFGGEELTPPAYGKVFISIKPNNGVYISTSIKENVLNQLRKYSVAGIVPQITDLKYLYVESVSNVYYNSNLAPSASFVETQISGNITNYSKSQELNDFGARFKYSKYLNIIDNSHQSVTSNITTVDMRRDLRALINQFAEYEICFGNRFHIKSSNYNIRSSGFSVSGISGTVYLGDSVNSDNQSGSMFLFKLNSPTEPVIVKNNVGIVDYVKGEIKINPLKIISTQINRGTPLIEISACPYSNDVIGLQDLYLQLDMANVNVSMIPDNISSGEDISGSNYKVSSSYYKGGLVRGTPILTSTVETTNTVTQTTTTTTPRTTTSVSGTGLNSYN